MAGSTSTLCHAKIKLKLPELYVMTHISGPFHITAKKCNFDKIFGRNLLQKSGIQLDFQNNFISWQDINIPMKAVDHKMSTHFRILGSKNVRNATKKIKKT